MYLKNVLLILLSTTCFLIHKSIYVKERILLRQHAVSTVKNLVTLQPHVDRVSAVKSAQGFTTSVPVSQLLTCVLTAGKIIRHLFLIALTMRLLQLNCQSLQTSRSLIELCLEKYNVDVLLLQEVWNPRSSFIKNFRKPLILLRPDGYGGVGIWVNRKAKVVDFPDVCSPDLEAVFAEVMIHNVRCLVGSVYIKVNKLEDISRLSRLVDRIKSQFPAFILCMDSY